MQPDLFSSLPDQQPAETNGEPTPESITAFKRAIAEGRLSENPKHENYAGMYMFMGPSLQGLKDQFKNKYTRQYLK